MGIPLIHHQFLCLCVCYLTIQQDWVSGLGMLVYIFISLFAPILWLATQPLEQYKCLTIFFYYYFFHPLFFRSQRIVVLFFLLSFIAFTHWCESGLFSVSVSISFHIWFCVPAPANSLDYHHSTVYLCGLFFFFVSFYYHE